MDPGTSNVQYRQLQIANTEFYGFYVQDDWKVTPKITLNLGLRYEYQGGLWDPEYRLPQQLDLTDPIPGMAEAIDPKIPADIRAIMAQSAGATGYTYNGAFYFTEEGSKRKTNAWTGGFMPRIGLAWRLDEKTAFRAGYGRFVTPTELANSERDTLGEIDLAAFNPMTNGLSNVNGVPVAFLANPFPQGLTPAYGKSYGRNTNLGDNVSWDEYEQRTPVSDRINVSLQREIPFRIVADATYFINFISHDQYSQNLNLIGPAAALHLRGGLVDKAIAEPVLQLRDGGGVPGRAAPPGDDPLQPAAAARTRSTSTSSRPAPTCARRSTSRSSCACSGRSPTASRSWRPTRTSSRNRSGSTTRRTSTTAS